MVAATTYIFKSSTKDLGSILKVHVTTSTLTADSARFIERFITDNNLPGQVILQDLR